jgi:hypothetical protein
VRWDELNERLGRACAIFMERDQHLLCVEANERSMTHKFAEYLQREFPEWDVDCEYNRSGHVPKRLRTLVPEWQVSPEDENATTVFPDIIVHRRGAKENLLVIEAKKSGTSDTFDRAKLAAYMSEDAYNYLHAVLVRFVTAGTLGVTIERVLPEVGK